MPSRRRSLDGDRDDQHEEAASFDEEVRRHDPAAREHPSRAIGRECAAHRDERAKQYRVSEAQDPSKNSHCRYCSENEETPGLPRAS